MATKDKSDRDLTVTEPSNLASPTPFQIMIRAMEMEATADEGTFAGDDLNSILAAESEEEIWDADERGPLNFQHLDGCELGIMGISVKFSRGVRDDIATPFVVTTPGRNGESKTKKMYLLVKAVRLSDAGEKTLLRLPAVGEVFEANTSARFVVAKLWAFYTKGYINPDTGRVLNCMVKATDLGDGQAVLKLRPMPNRSVRSEAS